MFEISLVSNNEILLSGRFDATQAEKASEIFKNIQETHMVNFEKLEYISSAGLSVLLKTQKRLKTNRQQLKLKNMNKHIREIFKYAGFDMIFEIE
jgi:anti-sigma B factor antagonist